MDRIWVFLPTISPSLSCWQTRHADFYAIDLLPKIFQIPVLIPHAHTDPRPHIALIIMVYLHCPKLRFPLKTTPHSRARDQVGPISQSLAGFGHCQGPNNSPAAVFLSHSLPSSARDSASGLTARGRPLPERESGGEDYKITAPP